MNKKIISIFFIVIIIFTGCNGNKNKFTNSVDSSKKNLKSNINYNKQAKLQLYNGKEYIKISDIESKLKEEKNIKNHVVWCVPTVDTDMEIIKEKNIKKINNYIQDKYNCCLNILYLTDDANGSYGRSLLSYLKNKYVDIYFSGFTYSDEDYNFYEKLIKDNYAYDITYDLKKEKNSSLYHAFNENEWKGMEYNGHVFAIPNQDFLTHRAYAAFKKNKFSKSEIEKLSDNLEDILKYVENKKIYKEKMLWDISYYDILNTIGICDMGGMWYSHTDGSVDTTFNNTKFKNIIKSLNSLYNKRVIMDDISINDDVSETLNSINQKKSDIAFFIDDATAENLNSRYYVKILKYYYKAYDYCNTMINARADKHDESIKIIDKLLNDRYLSVLLVNGEKNHDYKLINGYVYDMEGNEKPSNYIKTIFGISDNAYNSKSSDFGKNVREGKKKYFSSAECNISVINGYKHDYQKIGNYESAYLMLDTLCKSKNFESDYKKMLKENSKKEVKARIKAEKAIAYKK